MQTTNKSIIEVPTIEVYRGQELLVLNPHTKWPIKFGLAKAEVIMSHMTDIQEFIQTQREKLDEDASVATGK